MTALVFVATFVPRIPIPLGYAHLGDAVIFFLAISMERREAFLAACLGSALSDILGGFLIWAGPTLVIKLVMAYIVWHLAAREDAGRLRTLMAFILSSLWMAFAYTVFGALLYDSLAAGLASAPGLLMEGAVNTLAALALLPAVRRIMREYNR
ncbi:MAG: ECF transporter S component [Selenomonadaceae bacterium]|nr:ECF transporter S component [Selenomonadaceae bacterium]